MSQFLGGGDHDESSLLDYEATLKALRSLIGRQVLPRRVRTGLLAATNKLTIHLGDWTGNAKADHSTFSIDFSARNLGNMLSAFGYAGVVDEYDGVFQHLNLEAGPHHIEIEVPDEPPFAFDVILEPGLTMTYHTRFR